TILESASVCPASRGHLSYDEAAIARDRTKVKPLRIAGSLSPPGNDEHTWEYAIVLSIRNERGEDTNRQVIGVGALYPGDQRSFTLEVEMTEATGAKARRRH